MEADGEVRADEQLRRRVWQDGDDRLRMVGEVLESSPAANDLDDPVREVDAKMISLDPPILGIAAVIVLDAAK
jgi:hypothetical protein